jgi:hypothetical protein
VKFCVSYGRHWSVIFITKASLWILFGVAHILSDFSTKPLNIKHPHMLRLPRRISYRQFTITFCIYFFFYIFSSSCSTLEHMADFSVSWSLTDGRTPWTDDQLVARLLPKHRTTQTQKNAYTHQTSMPWVGFEPTIPASERAKTVHVSDCSATVTGFFYITTYIFRPSLPTSFLS